MLNLSFRIICTKVVLGAFILSTCVPGQSLATVAHLPVPGAKVFLSNNYNPTLIKGMRLYPESPLKFDFIVDVNPDSQSSNKQIQAESKKLIGYFLTALTTPESDNWVNLSPYEKDRIIPSEFGKTQMGQDLLAQDYLLKQIMATAMDPTQGIGKQFWQEVYKQAQAQFGTTDIKVNTFNKVWITPDKAEIYENAKTNSVFITKSSLKVMLEKDFLAANKAKAQQQMGLTPRNLNLDKVDAISQEIIRQIVLPALEREINEGEHFANLRQVYQSLILAMWYKKNFKNSVLSKGYANRNKVDGAVNLDPALNQAIYKQYLQAYRKGVVNLIQEEMDYNSNKLAARAYFSGGWAVGKLDVVMKASALLPTLSDRTFIVQAGGELLDNMLRAENGRVVNNAMRTGSDARLARLTRAIIVSLVFVGFYASTVDVVNVFHGGLGLQRAYAGGADQVDPYTQKMLDAVLKKVAEGKNLNPREQQILDDSKSSPNYKLSDQEYANFLKDERERVKNVDIYTQTEFGRIAIRYYTERSGRLARDMQAVPPSDSKAYMRYKTMIDDYLKGGKKHAKPTPEDVWWANYEQDRIFLLQNPGKKLTDMPGRDILFPPARRPINGRELSPDGKRILDEFNKMHEKGSLEENGSVPAQSKLSAQNKNSAAGTSALDGAMITRGGIDLEKTDVRTNGAGVVTGFDNPEILAKLEAASGLVPVVYGVQPLTSAMAQALLAK